MGVVRGSGQSAFRRLKRWEATNSTSTLQVSPLAASFFQSMRIGIITCIESPRISVVIFAGARLWAIVK